MATGEVVVRHQVAIAGQVTDAQAGQSIARALIRITRAPVAFTNWLAIRAKQYGIRWAAMVERPDQTQTAADGHFHFLDLPDGDYTLTASLPGFGSRYGTAQRQVTVSRNAEGRILMAPADIVLPPTTLKGRIVGQNDNPVGVAEVRVQGSGERAFSDGQGNYLMNGLEVGKRTVAVSAQGYQSASQAVVLGEAGNVQMLNFTLVSP